MNVRFYSRLGLLSLALVSTTAGETESGPLTFGATLTGDTFRNINGGLAEGDASAALLELTLDIDLEATLGLRGAHLHLLTFSGFGTDISERFVGDQSVVSNIFSPYDFNFFHLYWEQELAWGHDSMLKFGQFAADDDFMGAETAGLFINSSFGPFNTQSSNTTAPIFPLGAPGLFTQLGLSDSLSLKLAVFAGDAGGEDLDTHGFDWRLGGSAGIASFAELSWQFQENSTFTLGGHHHSGELTDFATGQTENGFGLIYATIDHRISGGSVPLSSFARVSVALEEDRAVAHHTFDTGFVWENLLHEGTALGLGLSHTTFGEAYRAAEPGVSSHETIIEATASIPVNEHLSVQPDLQYIFDSHTANRDAFAVGLRLQATF